MWDLIVSVPDHCLSFYFVSRACVNSSIFLWKNRQIRLKINILGYHGNRHAD